MSRNRLVEKEMQKRHLEEMMKEDEKDGFYETPAHYNNSKGYDIIDVAQDYQLNFNRGSALKYIARAGRKDNEIKDLEKAIDFLQREIKYLKTR